MFSEKAQKQLLLISGTVSALGGVVGGVTDFLRKIEIFNELPLWALWIAYAALFLFGLWLLIKWRTRYSRLLKPDALRLNRDNVDHLVGRADEVENLRQLCIGKQIVFLEGESGSGKSALVRSGLLPRLSDDKFILPLLLADLWVDHWEHGPLPALKIAMIESGAFGSSAGTTTPQDNPKPAVPSLFTLSHVERELIRLNDETGRTALIVFDQFDDYQARNRERFLPNRTWLDPSTLRGDNPFWEMVARLVEQSKLRCLFVTRSDAAGGLTSVRFVESTPTLRLDRVPAAHVTELLSHLTEGKPDAPVIEDPEAGWYRLRDRIVHDVSQQDVVLPQQLKIMLGGIQSLKRLNIVQYQRAGGASGIEALYVERQIMGTARKVEADAGEVRAILAALVDPSNPIKTWSRSKQDLAHAAARASARAISDAKLNNILEELERGEMIRSATDLHTGLTAYRLDHDYLTRGVSAAERRAHRWYYLLEDGAKAFENAGSLAKQWKTLLPVGTQFRLGWERLQGSLRYGQQRNYALVSLARFAPLAVLLVVFGLGTWQFSRWHDESTARETAHAIWRKFEFRRNVDEQDLDGAWMLAGMADDRVREEFVRQMLISREYASRFLREPGLVVQALVGINPRVREKVAPIVEASLRKERYEIMEIAAATVATGIGKLDVIKPSLVVEAIKATKDADQLGTLRQMVVAFGPRLKPDDSRALARLIVEALKSTQDTGQRNALSPAIVSLASQLRTEDARALADLLLEAVIGTTDLTQLRTMKEGLTALARQLSGKDARAFAELVLDAIKATDGFSRLALLQLLPAAVAPKLSADDAYALALLTKDAVRSATFGQLGALTPTFGVLAQQLRAEDAGVLAAAIIEPVIRVPDSLQQGSLLEMFATLAPKLQAEEARALADRIVGSIKGATGFNPRRALLPALARLAPQLREEDARALASSLVEIIDGERGSGQMSAFAEAFAAFARAAKAEGARALANQAVGVIRRMEGEELDDVAPAVTAIAPHLGAQDAHLLAARIVLRIMDVSTRSSQRRDLAQAFLALSLRLNPDDARAFAASLFREFRNAKSRRFGLGDRLRDRGLPVHRSIPGELRSPTRDLFLLQQDVSPRRSIDHFDSLALALSGLAPHLKAEDTRAIAISIFEMMKGAEDSDHFSELQRALMTLARHDRESARAVAVEAAKALRDLELDPILASRDARGGFPYVIFSILAPQLNAGEVREIAKLIVESIEGTEESRTIRTLVQAFAVLAPELRSEHALTLAESIVEAIKRARKSEQLKALSQVFVTLAPRLKLEGARALSKPIVEAIKSARDAVQVRALGQALTTIAPHLTDGEAHSFAGPIVEALQQWSDGDLAAALAALAAHVPWSERLPLLVSALKYPTVYGKARDILVEAVKEHPESWPIKPPVDAWALIVWLRAQPGVDLSTPPSRAKATNS